MIAFLSIAVVSAVFGLLSLIPTPAFTAGQYYLILCASGLLVLIGGWIGARKLPDTNPRSKT